VGLTPAEGPPCAPFSPLSDAARLCPGWTEIPSGPRTDAPGFAYCYLLWTQIGQISTGPCKYWPQNLHI